MMWDLIEKPDTSRAAQVISVLSTMFVAVSIVGMTISTLEILQYKDQQGNTIDNPTLAMIETVCIAWFTLEYFIRLAGSPDKIAFLKDGMNIVISINLKNIDENNKFNLGGCSGNSAFLCDSLLHGPQH